MVTARRFTKAVVAVARRRDTEPGLQVLPCFSPFRTFPFDQIYGNYVLNYPVEAEAKHLPAIRHRPLMAFYVLAATFVFGACTGDRAANMSETMDTDSVGRVSAAISHSCQKATYSGDAEADPLHDVSPAVVMDAQSYADDFGVELGEAVVRLQGQGVIGELGHMIQRNEPDTYAGHWIQHEPQYRMVVAFTRDGGSIICPYIEGHPLFDIVEVRSAVATIVELDRSQTEAMNVANEVGIPSESSIKVMQNSVELYVLDSGQLDSALEKAGLALPDHVQVIEVSSHSVPAMQAEGGQ